MLELNSPEIRRWKDGVDMMFIDHMERQVDRKDNEASKQITRDVYDKWLELSMGRRYIKAIVTSGGDTGRSVYAFIDRNTGDILKPAGWSAPAKHARGNVFADDHGIGCCNPYGVAYLR